MNLVAALDTMAWIWALKPTGQAKNEAERVNCERAASLFTWLENQQAQIIIPAICAAELLTPLEEPEQNKMLALIAGRCRPAMFDLSSAALAAHLQRLALADREKQPANKPARHILRADTLIVASAKTAGATHFFTEDRRCKSIAVNAGLVVMGLDDDPNMPLLSHRS